MEPPILLQHHTTSWALLVLLVLLSRSHHRPLLSLHLCLSRVKCSIETAPKACPPSTGQQQHYSPSSTNRPVECDGKKLN
uniref:Putative secreted peptide n=1 Tax=Anopheles braziliensis TaxID=58242 RepID=A0A2M3ZWP2_9DIPT